MFRFQRDRYERILLVLAQSVTVGAAYVVASPIPGLTSSFVAIFTSLLPFDIIVASDRPPILRQDWKRLFVVLRPRVLSTGTTLLQGVAVATVFGILVTVGLPLVVGAVLTVGLAYVWALATRHVISAYVSIFAGLALFERLAALDALHTARIVEEIAAVIVSSGGGTLVALFAGWLVGLFTGSVTRLFLSRPYRTLRSSAYELPLEMRPFKEVLHVGEKSLVVSAVVEDGAPVAYRSLAESNLRDQWGTTVLSVKRGGEEVVMPAGSFVLLPQDELLLLTDRERSSVVVEQFKAPPAAAGSRNGPLTGTSQSRS